MKTTSTKQFLLCGSALTFALMGCDSGGSGSAHPETAVSLQLKIQSQAASATALTSNTALRADSTNLVEASTVGVSFTEARLSISEIRIELPVGVDCSQVTTNAANVSCEAEDHNEVEDESSDDNPHQSSSSSEAKLKIAGPFVVDLIAGTFTPSIDDLKLPAGVYKKIELRSEDGDYHDGVIESDDDMNGKSLFASGTFTDSSDSSHDFNLALRFNEDITIELTDGVAVSAGITNALQAVWTLSDWFAGVDLAECVDNDDLEFETDGSLTIDEDTDGGSCGDIEGMIKDNIKGSGKMESHEEENEVENEED